MAIPKYVYRYQAFNSFQLCRNAHRLLLRNHIYAPSPSSFNDPFDCRARLCFDDATPEAMYAWLRQFRAGGSADHEQIYREMRQLIERGLTNASSGEADTLNRLYDLEFERDFNNGMGVICFGGQGDDALMWSHYADGHRGLCFQFRAADLNLPGHFSEVYYHPSDLLPTVQEETGDFPEMGDKFFIFRKSKKWEYENEYRLYLDDIVARGGRMIELPETALSGVILGWKMSPEQKGGIWAWKLARNTKGLPPVAVYEAKPNRKTYDVNIEGLES